MSLPAAHEDVPAKVAAAMERIGQAFRVLSQREAQAHGLSPIQLQLLLRLAADPPERRRPGALAREFDVSPASLSDSIASIASSASTTSSEPRCHGTSGCRAWSNSRWKG